jgi:hypothetical protein
VTDYVDPLQQARAHLAADEPREAADVLRPHLRYPCQLEGPELSECLEVFAEALQLLDLSEVAQRLRVAKDLDEVTGLYEAAYSLYEANLHGLAATLLDRADRLAPGRAKILSELSANLEALMLYGEAARRLSEGQVADESPICRYLLGFNQVMSGDLRSPRQALPALQASTDPTIQGMAVDLAGMLARGDAVREFTSLDAQDLRGWHMVINGTALLHLSPYGFPEPMAGRYAYVSDSVALIREGLVRLKGVLEAGQVSPSQVVGAPDRSSQIVATAAARYLDLPLVPWPAQAVPEGLVVVYDLDRVGIGGVLERLKTHAPGQVLFSHASCWTNPFPYSPDVTTFLYQTLAAPWTGETLAVDPETREVGSVDVEQAPTEAIAEQILEAELGDMSEESAEELRLLVSAVRAAAGENAAGLFREAGTRYRQRAGSVVKSARF